MGAASVGMSTVPEIMAGSLYGMRVLAISVVTNIACGIESNEVTLDEIVNQD